MSKNYAKFDQERYDKFDGKAKNALISYLEQEGHSIKSAAEDYHADVTSTRQGATYYSEAEVKTAWKEAWPKDWAELRIPARKARLLKRHSIITFYVFRSDLKECWVVKGEQLTLDSLKEAYGPKISKGEMFFHIPVKEAKLIRHDENGWTEIVQEDTAPQKTTTGAKNRKAKAVSERTEDKPTDDSAGSSGDG